MRGVGLQLLADPSGGRAGGGKGWARAYACHVVIGDLPLPSVPGLDVPVVLTRAEQDRGIGGTIAALRFELSHGAPDLEVCSALVRALWLRSLAGRVATHHVDLGLLEVIQGVLARPEDIATVGELARRCRLSRSRFNERFVEGYGQPPGPWLRLTRMRHARQLLTSSRLSVAQVAERLGYASETAFRKAYRRELGEPARARR